MSNPLLKFDGTSVGGLVQADVDAYGNAMFVETKITPEEMTELDDWQPMGNDE
jgi:hypothetical protein